MPSQVAATADERGDQTARPGCAGQPQRDRRRARPAARCDKIAPIVIADSETASAIATRQASPASRTRTPRAAARSGADRAEQQRPVQHQHDAQREHAERPRSTGMMVLLMVNIEPNRMVIVAPVVLVMRGVPVQEQRRQAEPGAAHDAGGQVAAARPADADHVHDPGGQHARWPRNPTAG